jgi:hypothetical protein
VNHQANVAKRFMGGLHTVTGMANNLLARRPFFVFWFMSQVSRYAWFLSRAWGWLIIALTGHCLFGTVIILLPLPWMCAKPSFHPSSISRRCGLVLVSTMMFFRNKEVIDGRPLLPEQRKRYEKLRERLANACFVAGLPSLPTINLTLPANSSSTAII